MQSDSRFRQHALLLVVLLCGWEVARGYFSSPWWLESFTHGPSLADLDSLSDGTTRSAEGHWLIANRKEGYRVKLPTGALDAESWLLLRLLWIISSSIDLRDAV